MRVEFQQIPWALSKGTKATIDLGRPALQLADRWEETGGFSEPADVFKPRLRAWRDWLVDRPERTIACVCHTDVTRCLTGHGLFNCEFMQTELDEEVCHLVLCVRVSKRRVGGGWRHGSNAFPPHPPLFLRRPTAFTPCLLSAVTPPPFHTHTHTHTIP